MSFASITRDYWIFKLINFCLLISLFKYMSKIFFCFLNICSSDFGWRKWAQVWYGMLKCTNTATQSPSMAKSPRGEDYCRTCVDSQARGKAHRSLFRPEFPSTGSGTVLIVRGIRIQQLRFHRSAPDNSIDQLIVLLFHFLSIHFIYKAIKYH